MELDLKRTIGEVSEWSKEHAWKVCKSKGFEGSNPSLTAIHKKTRYREYVKTLEEADKNPAPAGFFVFVVPFLFESLQQSLYAQIIDHRIEVVGEHRQPHYLLFYKIMPSPLKSAFYIPKPK